MALTFSLTDEANQGMDPAVRQDPGSLVSIAAAGNSLGANAEVIDGRGRPLGWQLASKLKRGAFRGVSVSLAPEARQLGSAGSRFASAVLPGEIFRKIMDTPCNRRSETT